MDALGRSSPLDDAEACVYGYGAIKFLTMNPLLLEKILNLGILQLMVLHIKLVNVTVSRNKIRVEYLKRISNISNSAKKNLQYQNKPIMPYTK